jgi:polyhydroxyalkanoate synthesis repressor PhaR
MTDPARALASSPPAQPGHDDGKSEAGKTAAAGATPVVVKKYANRRLYNTEASSYVTLDHLCAMVKSGRDFVVYDAKSGEDITRQVLTQIIVEEESKGGQNLLPIGFLRQLIGFYGDNLQSLVPRYLEHTMGAFAKQQETMRNTMRQTMEGLFPFAPQLEEMGKQNIAIMERALGMFSPFYPREGGRAEPSGPTATPEERHLEALKAEVERLRAQIDALNAAPRG